MKTQQNEAISFYQNIGKLFYAIAASDNKINEVEYNTLKSIVQIEWLTADALKDNFNTDFGSLIINVFKWLNYEQEYNAKECYNSFIGYKNMNEHLFTYDIKLLIMRTAGRIAASFSGKNKSELIMLANLNIEFNKQQKDEE